MSNKTDRLKLEFTKLTDSERADFKKFVDRYEQSGYIQKSTLNESLRKSLGPTDVGKCGCCGK